MGRLQFVARSSTSIQQRQSWIITQSWCCAGPRLDRTRDVSPRTKIDTELQEQRVKDSEYTPLASLVFLFFFVCGSFCTFCLFFWCGSCFFLFYAPLAFFSLMTLPTRCTTQKENKRKSGTLSFRVATDCLISHDLLWYAQNESQGKWVSVGKGTKYAFQIVPKLPKRTTDATANACVLAEINQDPK